MKAKNESYIGHQLNRKWKRKGWIKAKEWFEGQEGEPKKEVEKSSRGHGGCCLGGYRIKRGWGGNPRQFRKLQGLKESDTYSLVPKGIVHSMAQGFA